VDHGREREEEDGETVFSTRAAAPQATDPGSQLTTDDLTEYRL
jgi:hypothetical protein